MRAWMCSKHSFKKIDNDKSIVSPRLSYSLASGKGMKYFCPRDMEGGGGRIRRERRREKENIGLSLSPPLRKKGVERRNLRNDSFPPILLSGWGTRPRFPIHTNRKKSVPIFLDRNTHIGPWALSPPRPAAQPGWRPCKRRCRNDGGKRPGFFKKILLVSHKNIKNYLKILIPVWRWISPWLSSLRSEADCSATNYRKE